MVFLARYLIVAMGIVLALLQSWGVSCSRRSVTPHLWTLEMSWILLRSVT